MKTSNFKISQDDHGGKQARKLWNHLNQGNTLTRLDAYHLYGILHPAEYIRQFREAGHLISTTRVKSKNGGHYAVYKLEKKAS